MKAKNKAQSSEKIASLVPQPVADYIAQYGLYGALSAYRFRHTLSVARRRH